MSKTETALETNDLHIDPQAIAKILTIKKTLIEDNDLSLSVAGCGCHVVDRYIDRLVQQATQMETAYYHTLHLYQFAVKNVEEFRDLLQFEPDELDKDETAELKQLVHKWQQRRAAEDAGA